MSALIVLIVHRFEHPGLPCIPEIDGLEALRSNISRSKLRTDWHRRIAEFANGSGVMGERLANGNIALALLANTIATGAALVAIILAFGSISGAHLNPAVTLADAIERGLSWTHASQYAVVQIFGGLTGTVAAHLMFGLPAISFSQHVRSGPAQFLSEFIATFGLVSVIWACSRARTEGAPFAMGAYITAAYWFTASMSFANPAVTIARSLGGTFAGIRSAHAPLFILAQVLGHSPPLFCSAGLFRPCHPLPKTYSSGIKTTTERLRSGPAK
jgi:glycerol uptake facilitator-like aquaporin